MADEADPRAEGAVAVGAGKIGRWARLRDGVSAALPFLAQILLISDTPRFIGGHSRSDLGSPGRTVSRGLLPGGVRNVALFESLLQTVFISFFQLTERAFARGELPIEQSLWKTAVVHAVNVASPPKLRAQQYGINALTLRTLQYLSIWYFILPLDRAGF